jgi:hypothetical protein
LAKYGHAIEVWMGIPGWEAWFSTPDLVTNQIFEAILFLVIFGTVGLLLLTHRMGLGPRDWKPPVRLTTAMPIAMWLEVCVVSLLSWRFRVDVW